MRHGILRQAYKCAQSQMSEMRHSDSGIIMIFECFFFNKCISSSIQTFIQLQGVAVQ